MWAEAGRVGAVALALALVAVPSQFGNQEGDGKVGYWTAPPRAGPGISPLPTVHFEYRFQGNVATCKRRVAVVAYCDLATPNRSLATGDRRTAMW